MKTVVTMKSRYVNEDGSERKSRYDNEDGSDNEVEVCQCRR